MITEPQFEKLMAGHKPSGRMADANTLRCYDGAGTARHCWRVGTRIGCRIDHFPLYVWCSEHVPTFQIGLGVEAMVPTLAIEQ